MSHLVREEAEVQLPTLRCANCDRELPRGTATCPACCPPDHGSILTLDQRNAINRHLRRSSGHTLFGAVGFEIIDSNLTGVEAARQVYDESGVDDPWMRGKIERAELWSRLWRVVIIVAIATFIVMVLSNAR